MMKDAPAIYARHLTAEEMREIAAFYRTPTGTKDAVVPPQILAEIFATMLPGVPAVNDTHDEFLKLLRERGYVK